VLSAVTCGQLARLVKQREVGALRRIKGVGQRTAERLVLELQGKLKVPEEAVETAPATAAVTCAPFAQDVLSALRNLGFKTTEANAAVAQALRENPTGDLDCLVTSAVRNLGKTL
jgi:Holliday junction DNA helicase RuvA